MYTCIMMHVCMYACMWIQVVFNAELVIDVSILLTCMYAAHMYVCCSHVCMHMIEVRWVLRACMCMHVSYSRACVCMYHTPEHVYACIILQSTWPPVLYIHIYIHTCMYVRYKGISCAWWDWHRKGGKALVYFVNANYYISTCLCT